MPPAHVVGGGGRRRSGDVTAPRQPARLTAVSETEGLLRIEPLLLPPTTDVLEAIRTAAAHPETRVIGVIDDGGRLVGVVPILRLAEAAIARAAPEAIMSSLVELDEIAEFSHAIEARTIGEAMLPPAAITRDATIDVGFRRMHERDLSGIYVVDDEGRPIGYLDLLELAVFYADVLEREAQTGGDDPGARQ